MTHALTPHPRDPRRRYLEFHGLMPFRVHEILLLSSAYDAFILEEDGPLTDQIFGGYSDLHLTQTPRITHVTSGSAALRLLRQRRFDLVITVVRVEDTDAAEFSKAVKREHPDMGVLLLIFDVADLRAFSGGVTPSTIDQVFLWTGDASILIAGIKVIEDARNAEHDTTVSGVQVIVVVEDDLQAYSTFLSLLYRELLLQSQSLIAEAVNELHRLVRMRARPKILLAKDYEEGIALLRRYRRHLMALITDARFPKEGAILEDAGVQLVRRARRDHENTPILIQSTSPGIASRAAQLGAVFIDKNSPDYPAHVRHFLKESLGFGPFVFRLGDGTEVNRAQGVYEMEKLIDEIPAESIFYHASRNHFSTWLNARSMFGLASQVRAIDVEDFAEVEGARRYLIQVLEEARRAEQDGVITDFSPKQTGPSNRFVRVGKGSIGGKGRSIAFVNSLIVNHRLLRRFEDLEIRIPKTIVLGTDEYDRFMEDTAAASWSLIGDDEEIMRRFLESSLPEAVKVPLQEVFADLRGPLAVRSSSLLEDSRFFPFAGVYSTYMLPNNHPDPEVRFEELCRAITAVYASGSLTGSRRYLEQTPHARDEEKMAVVIQQVVGQRFGDRHYPHLSGVAKSYSYYAVGSQDPEDGIAEIALGMGEMVVSGGATVQFSPSDPGVSPQFPDTKAYLRRSQSSFYAVDLSRTSVDLLEGPKATLKLCDLEVAEEDGTLALSGSVYSPDDDVIRDNLALPGTRLVTFNNVLRWNAVPLADALRVVLDVLRDGIGGEIEIEFALDMGDWGRLVPHGERRKVPRLYILQVRPMVSLEGHHACVEFDEVPEEDVVCRTDRALGDGVIENIRDIIYVPTEVVDHTTARQVASEIATFDKLLRDDERPYLLIGPGRWGSSDPSLGIPVEWQHICGARVIVETPMQHRAVEPSQGTHFFQNVVAMRVGYLTVGSSDGSSLDEDWLRSLAPVRRKEGIRWLQLDAPLSVLLNGRAQSAMVVRGTSRRAPGRTSSRT